VQKGITAGESGKEYQQTLGYYTSLSNALEAIARDEAMSVSYDTIQEFINTYNQIMNRLSKIIKI
jgi:oligoendopeptidase F